MDPTPDVEPATLVSAIRGPSPQYKRAAVEAIVARREETTPHLLAILQELLDDPGGALERMDDTGIFYAMGLLAYFREPAAHDLIVRIARLPGQLAEDLLGDFLTDDMANVLLLTCGGRIEGLRSVLQDPAANEYSRAEAVTALVMAVGLGYAPRDEILALLMDHLSLQSGFVLASIVLVEMLKLYPVEHRETLRRAFEEDIVDPSIVDWEGVERDLDAGPQAAAQELAKRCERAQGTDVHSWFPWWDNPWAPDHAASRAQAERDKKQKAEAKKARKRQRAARKAQRKKR